jgi:hypothetical protein
VPSELELSGVTQMYTASSSRKLCNSHFGRRPPDSGGSSRTAHGIADAPSRQPPPDAGGGVHGGGTDTLCGAWTAAGGAARALSGRAREASVWRAAGRPTADSAGRRRRVNNTRRAAGKLRGHRREPRRGRRRHRGGCCSFVPRAEPLPRPITCDRGVKQHALKCGIWIFVV